MEDKEKEISSLLRLIGVAVLLFIPFFIWYVEQYESEETKGFLADNLYRVVHFDFHPLHYLGERLQQVNIKRRPEPPWANFTTEERPALLIKIFVNTNDATHVKVERAGKGLSDQFKLIADLPASNPQFTDLDVELNATYRYRFQSCFWSSCGKWSESMEATVRTAPLPPKDLKVEAVPPWQAKLSYAKASPQTRGFEITVWPADASMPVTRFKSTSESVMIGPLRPGAGYDLEVKAIGEAGGSDSARIHFDNPSPRGRPQGPSLPEGDGAMAFLWNGKEWAIAGVVQEHAYNQYFKGPRDFYGIRFDHASNKLHYDYESGSTVLEKDNLKRIIDLHMAWSGKTYGLVLTELPPYANAAPAAKQRSTLVFCPLSAGGKRLTRPKQVVGPQFDPMDAKIFWERNHFALFWLSRNRLFYCPLDWSGQSLAEPRVVVESVSPGVAIGQGINSFGIAWADSNDGELYFMTFIPGSSDPPKRLRLTDDYYGRGMRSEPGSVFWTGKEYGLCWSEGQSQVMVHLISPRTNVPRQIIYSQNLCRAQCIADLPKQSSFRVHTTMGWPETYHPACSYADSEILLLAYEKFYSTNPDLVAYRFTADGKQEGEKLYLPGGDPYMESSIAAGDNYYLIWISSWLELDRENPK